MPQVAQRIRQKSWRALEDDTSGPWDEPEASLAETAISGCKPTANRVVSRKGVAISGFRTAPVSVSAR
jgi:hypothetical protein